MTVITSLAIGVIGLSIGDQVAPPTQPPAEYRVVSEKESRFEEELNRAAADGYRVVHGDAGVQVAILERSSDGPRRSYVFARDVDDFLKRKKLQPGYRLVERTFAGNSYAFGGIFERVDGDDRMREYSFIKAGSSGKLRERVAKGGEPQSAIAIAWGGSGVAAILEAGRETTNAGIVASGNTGNLRQDLRAAGEQGQCLLDGDGIKEALYLVANCASAGARAYDVIATTKAETFEKELNALAASGMRLVPASLVSIEKRVLMGTYNYEHVGVLEKLSDATPVTYRVIGTVRLGTFTRELQKAATAGFRLVGFAIGPKEQIAVLEQAGRSGTSASPAIVTRVKRGDIVAVTRWSEERVKGQVAGVSACSILLRTPSTMIEIGAAEIKTIRRYAPPKENPGARAVLQVAEQCDDVGCAPAALAYVGVAALIQGIQDLSRPPAIVYRGRRTQGPQDAECRP